MVVVAVAGGTGGVGKTIVEQLQLVQNHHILVLSRNVFKEPQGSQALEYVPVNYDNVDAMVKMLEDHAIHTIISAINLQSEAASRSQLNLIAAADRSSVTKRFTPSEYAFIANSEYITLCSQLH